VKESEADVHEFIEQLEQLMIILDGLHRQQDSVCASTRRFLQVPTVGSLNQLRAELQVRYSGQHHWVRTPSGRKIDAMFISCKGAGRLEAGDAPKVDASSLGSSPKEYVPMKEVISEVAACSGDPVIVWCNPNAGYYETMAYDSHWLDFYLSQGCSVLLFNYSGFGRSEGHPTPRAVASDGNAVIEFLRRRGFSQIGVHGRSIGGICACSLAQAHPDVVKILIADRTFSTLAKVAKYTFGNWAVKGLSLSATWADNHQNYEKSRCYKVMICDPKDATIPDLAALRSSVAMEAVLQVPECNRFYVEDDKIRRLAEAWAFFDTLVTVCNSAACPTQGPQCTSCSGSLDKAAVIGKPEAERWEDQRVGKAGASPKGDDVEKQRLVSKQPQPKARTVAEVPKHAVNETWIEEHADVVQTVLARHIGAIHLVLDIVGTQMNASGMTLDNALRRKPLEEACEAFRCFLANIQIWGSLSSCSPSAHREIAAVFQQDVNRENLLVADRFAQLESNLTPKEMSVYQRQLTQASMSRVCREFRQQMSSVRPTLEQASYEYGTLGSALCATVLSHFREIEGFVTAICRFFESVDVASPSAAISVGVASSLMSECGTDASATSYSKESKESMERCRGALPFINPITTGFVLCIDSGHNGILSKSELHHLASHLRAARFGKYRLCTDEDAKGSA